MSCMSCVSWLFTLAHRSATLLFSSACFCSCASTSERRLLKLSSWAAMTLLSSSTLSFTRTMLDSVSLVICSNSSTRRLSSCTCWRSVSSKPPDALTGVEATARPSKVSTTAHRCSVHYAPLETSALPSVSSKVLNLPVKRRGVTPDVDVPWRAAVVTAV